MNYFSNIRIDWIAESLRVYGFIQRQHIIKKFGVCGAIATRDLQDFLDRHEGAAVYNPKSKRYELVRK